MTTPTLTTPPTPPSRSDPANWRSRSDAFFAWFATAFSELTTMIAWIVSTASDIAGYASSASSSAGTATTKAGLTAADAVATAADRVQTGLDRTAASNSASAAAGAAAAILATSTTSLAIAIASKTFTTQASKQFAAGQFVTATSAANSANYMHGQVTSYISTSLVVDVQDIGGSGTRGAPGAGISADATGFHVSGGATPKTLTVDVDLTASAMALASQLSIGLQTCWIPAGAMVARTTAGAASGAIEMATNKNMFKTLDFDTATAEYAQFCIQMPKSWNEGTVTAAFVWSHAATTTNFGVAFGLQGVATSNDDAGDVAFGTAQLAVDTGGTTNDIYVTPTTSAITIGGTPAANDYVMFQVYRAVADGGDTMAIDARLHGVQLYYTTDAATDA
ncbi:MAG: hypothetical protein NTX56_02795 [Proteobacteria bacterium]|nr:hypothetical protein [Pseudomonadota bacterium]